MTEIGLRTLLDAGFSQKDAAYAGMMFNDFVVMSVLEETQYTNLEAQGASQDSSLDVQNWVESLPPNVYPSLVALANYLTEPNGDERFHFGVELLRNGLETLLARGKD